MPWPIRSYMIYCPKKPIRLSQEESNMEFSRDDLNEAKRQIDSTLHKLRETIKTFESKENQGRYKSQITLARRRVKAFEIANYLIENNCFPIYRLCSHPICALLHRWLYKMPAGCWFNRYSTCWLWIWSICGASCKLTGYPASGGSHSFR